MTTAQVSSPGSPGAESVRRRHAMTERCFKTGRLAAAILLVVGGRVVAQPVTYVIGGELTSVPSCVSGEFKVGDSWSLEVIVGDPERPELILADERAGAETEPGSLASDTAIPSERGPDEGIRDADGADPPEEAAEPESALTVHHDAAAFAWTIGRVSGTADGETRVFISDNHLSGDAIVWQALDYSATFSPSSLGGTGIRGIQAGLIDTSGSVFSSLDLPGELARSPFDRGVFQVFFSTRCEPFGHDSLDGSIGSVLRIVGPGPLR